ncbi:MAG: ATPase [Berkelbacteria bacterium GW2011_GWA2_35_9]|uniref:ATPase n=1 Tax=Berkelbacteria bacterium GW2011_GWA2_35_9 TaxID=1618333 RepID=A0A0G0G8S6_9BACT|nr:MAG: ATPase [Berkelbacteria bacterium GW2011_GWA2_35_9]
MKKRFIFSELIKQINHKNALIITGMRQVGKTTLMRQVFDSLKNQPKLWFDFDNPLEQIIFEDIEYRNIYAKLLELSNTTKKERLYVFIDEIQNYPEITKIIKYLIDHYKVKFVLTGSSNYYLKNLFPESLSGRKFLYYLPPLSFTEYLYFNNIVQTNNNSALEFRKIIQQQDFIKYKKYQVLYSSYLQYGGFPEVVTTQDTKTKEQILDNILKSFFEKDLKILSDYKDIRDLRDLILLLAPRVGSLLDISKLASELGLDRPKIYSLLEMLQGTFFISLLPKYSKSIDRSVAGGKKVYFTDTGLLNTISQLNEAQILENSVINQLNKYGKISFYNQRNTVEIDAILNKKIAIEIKTKATGNDLNKLEKISLKLGLEQYFLISRELVSPEIQSQVIYPQFL